MATLSQSRLWIRPFIIHGAAAAVTMSYNVISRSYFYPSPIEDKLRLAGAGYFIAGSAATSLFTSYLLKRAESSSDYAAIPIWRALLSTLCWLGLIPVLGGMAVAINGQVDPIQFPNFCVSVIIGWLIATTFTTIFYAEELSLRPGLVWSTELSRLLWLIKTVPYFGTAIPIISAGLLLLMIYPNDQSSAGRILNNFLVGLYTTSAYGVFYLSRKARRVSKKLMELDS